MVKLMCTGKELQVQTANQMEKKGSGSGGNDDHHYSKPTKIDELQKNNSGGWNIGVIINSNCVYIDADPGSFFFFTFESRGQYLKSLLA